MSRHAVLGNGQLLALFDEGGRLRDLYYPYAGLENHVVNLKHRIGISVNSRFCWLSDLESNLSQSPETFKVNTLWDLEDEKVTIKSESLIYNERNILIRKFSVTNNKRTKCEIKLFFNQEFKIKENKYRNTGYYYPEKNVVIHYRGNRTFLVNIVSDEGGIDDYTIGMFKYEGKEGSYKNAETIHLSKSSVEHGPVDSVVAKTLVLEPNSTKSIYYCLIAEKDINEALKTNQFLQQKPPKHIFKSTSNYWKAWKKQRAISFDGLSTKAQDAYYRSLFVVKSHTDNNTGGILASGDTSFYENGKDFYAYVWARDAYFPAKAMLMLGYYSPAKNLLKFFDRGMNTQGYMPHKFEQDGSLGSSWHPWIKDGVMELPIQEDETAAVVHLLYDYFQITKDIEFTEEHFNKLIESTGNFLCTFVNHKMGVPEPSYDLWESKYLVTTYTTASVIAALREASELSEILGKISLKNKFIQVSNKLKEGLIKHLYNNKQKYFVNGIYTDNLGKHKYTDDTVDASTLFGLWYYNILEPEDEKFSNTLKKTNNSLRYEDFYYIRFENDDYFRENNKLPNAWFITTAWEILRTVRQAKTPDELKNIPKDIDKLVEMSTKSGLFSEQYNFEEEKIVSYTPLIWSHATYLELIATYIKKCEDFGICEICLPN